MAEDKSEKVLAAVASNLNTPISCLENLAEDTSSVVRIAVASNPNSPSDLLENLAKDENQAKDVYLAIVNNPSTPKNILKSPLEKFDLICRHLAANPNTPLEILRAIDRRATTSKSEIRCVMSVVFLILNL